MTEPNAPPTEPPAGDEDANSRRNFAALTVQQVAFRVAWIFKTETVMIPAFLDSVSATGWVRGMLPPLNRLGQSVAPLLLADHLRAATSKSRWLLVTTALMSLLFLLAGGVLIFRDSLSDRLIATGFLVVYSLFFCIHGVNQTAFATLQGKTVPPARRGALIAWASNAGMVLALIASFALLLPWTSRRPPAFDRIFLFTGGGFMVAALAVLLVRERADTKGTATLWRPHVRETVTRLRADPRLRRVCLISALFVCSQVLFPHYQNLGRTRPGFQGSMLMTWVIVQHIGVAVFGWLGGMLSDRRGTRSALRFLTAGGAVCPWLAVIVARQNDAGWFVVLFFFLSFVPVTYRILLNYVLELTSTENHPAYVGTTVICMVPPILLSPFAGALLDRVGYLPLYITVGFVVACSWLLTMTMDEPRHDTRTVSK